MIIFIKVCTASKPSKPKAEMNDLSAWPQIVQLAYWVVHADGLIFREVHKIIKPNESNPFAIDPAWQSFAGVTTEDCQTKGVPIGEALSELCAYLEIATLVVGHNIDFIRPVIMCEMIREPIKPQTRKYKFLCTMINTIEYCGIQHPSGTGNKYPTLTDLHSKLHYKPSAKPERLLDEVAMLSECYWKLRLIDGLELRTS